MKIFVFTDNVDIFLPIYNITKNINIDYFCSISSKSKFKNFPFIKAKNIKNDYVDLLNYNIGFSIHSNQIFPKKLVESVLCINLHPGYNPYNRGMFPHIFSIINKSKAGATLHIMDSKIDNGAIIAREEVPISAYDTSLSLYKKILKKEVKIFKKNFKSIIKKEFKAIKADSNNSNYNSMHDFKNICKINLNKIVTMQEAIDHLRALSHKPYNNAYFIDNDGNKIYVRLEIKHTKNNIMGGGRKLNLSLPKSA